MQGFPDREAARARDFITLYGLPLPLPFCGPDRAAYYFIGNTMPDVARTDVAAARRTLSEAFGVSFRWRDVWSSNGPRREYRAFLPSGLEIVITAKTEHMPEDEDGAEVRVLEEMAA